MASNAKNLAELLNTDTTVAVADVADGSITTAKLAADAVTTAKIADNSVTSAKSVNLGRRNILINGAFQHWQRNTSFSANGYGSDRWKLYAPGGHAYSRSTDTPDSPNNFEFSASVGGSGDATGLTQFVESRNAKHIPSSGTTKVILSFYLKHTTNSGTAKITSVVGTMDSADNSGASTNRSTKNHDTTTSWARYTHEMTGADLTAAVTNGLFITIKHNGSGTTAFLLTGCQLEINETVTPFETRSIGEELTLCERYYQKSYNYNTYPGANSSAGGVMERNTNAANISNRMDAGTRFVTRMRGTPTVTIYSLTGTVNNISDLHTGTNHSANQGVSSIQHKGTSGFGGLVISGGNDEGIGYQYTAEAEI